MVYLHVLRIFGTNLYWLALNIGFKKHVKQMHQFKNQQTYLIV